MSEDSKKTLDPQGVSMLAQRGALHLEMLGLRRSKGSSVYTLVKHQYGFRGNRQTVLRQLENLIEETYGPLEQRYTAYREAA